MQIDQDLKYAVNILKDNPSLIMDAWDFPYTRPGGVLFSHIGQTEKRPDEKGFESGCGCATQIKGGQRCFSEKIRQAILENDNIPADQCDIKVSDLDAFAEIQQLAREERKRIAANKVSA